VYVCVDIACIVVYVYIVVPFLPDIVFQQMGRTRKGGFAWHIGGHIESIGASWHQN